MSRVALQIALVSALALAGCASDNKGSVTGAVTLNGQPLTKGIINFSPLDPTGGTAGGDVVDGRYQVADLVPGKYQVHIEGVPEGKVVMPGDPETKRTLTDAEIEARAHPIPQGTPGNDQTIEIKPGSQTHDFGLETKAK